MGVGDIWMGHKEFYQLFGAMKDGQAHFMGDKDLYITRFFKVRQ